MTQASTSDTAAFRAAEHAGWEEKVAAYDTTKTQAPANLFEALFDTAKFPGKRPLIVDVHGGPEGQSKTGFAGAGNYILNELGIGVFLPNVRGSTGFGKTFVSLDNGPFKREDSVKDMAALIDAVRTDPAVDPAKVGVSGGSYGGYSSGGGHK